MRRCLHIGLAFAAAPKVDELMPAFVRAADWMRYAPNAWLVVTDATPLQWQAWLRPLLSSADQVMILEVDLGHRAGVLPQWAWDWLAKQAPYCSVGSAGA